MRTRDFIFIGIILFVVGGLYFLSTRARAPRPMPGNAAHQEARTRAECLTCHQAEVLANLEKQHRHPGKWRDEKVSCLQCHQNGSQVSDNRLPQIEGRAQSLRAAIAAMPPVHIIHQY